MDSFELNKIAGAVLIALLFLMGLGILSNALFDNPPPEVPGYVITVPEEGSPRLAQEEETEKVASIALRLAEADLDKGQKEARKCASCHSFEKGGANKTGPALYGILGRAVAERPDFAYSTAMKEFGQGKNWTYEELDRFLDSPKKVVPGTAMAFIGLTKPQERADVIAYLRSLSDSPEPLPPVEETPSASQASEEETHEKDSNAKSEGTEPKTHAPPSDSEKEEEPKGKVPN